MWIGIASEPVSALGVLPDPDLQCGRSSVESKRHGVGYAYAYDSSLFIRAHCMESGRYGHVIYVVLQEDIGSAAPSCYLSILILTPPADALGTAQIRECSRIQIPVPEHYRVLSIRGFPNPYSRQLEVRLLRRWSNIQGWDGDRVIIDVADPNIPIIRPEPGGH